MSGVFGNFSTFGPNLNTSDVLNSNTSPFSTASLRMTSIATTKASSIFQTDQPNINYAKVVATVVICVLGVFANLLSMFVIVVLKEYKKAVLYLYVLQLAIADMFFLLIIPFKASQDLHKKWPFSQSVCVGVETMQFLNYNASVLFFVVMSVDRYIAVCHPFSNTLNKFRTMKSAGIIIFCVWSASILFCIPIIQNAVVKGEEPHCLCGNGFEIAKNVNDEQNFCNTLDNKVYELCIEKVTNHDKQLCKKRGFIDELILEFHGNSTDENYDYYEYYENYHEILSNNTEVNYQTENPYKETSIPFMSASQCNYFGQNKQWSNFLIGNFVLLYILPVAVMSIAYGLIIKQVKFSKSSDKSNEKSLKIRNKVTYMSLSLVTAFIICWMPVNVLHMAKIKGINLSAEKGHICTQLSQFASIMAYLNSLFNPLFYSFFGTDFRKRFSRAKRTVKRSISLTNEKQKKNKMVKTRQLSEVSATAVTRMNSKSVSNVKEFN